MLYAIVLPLVLAGLARPTPVPVQDDAPDPQEAARTFVRTLAGADGELSLAEVRRGLAEIELLVVVEREFQAADQRLEELRHLMEEACRARPEDAEELYNKFIEGLSGSGLKVAGGKFGSDMLVNIHNDGPVTFILER